MVGVEALSKSFAHNFSAPLIGASSFDNGASEMHNNNIHK
jgi:hypothetical protein